MRTGLAYPKMTTSFSPADVINRLREMDEYEFEKLIAEIWQKQGWDTTVTTGAVDRGIDVIAEKNTPFSQKHLIQAKRYSEDNKVGSPEVQQYSSLRQQESDVDAVIIVSTSSFTPQAHQIADDLNVKLVDGNDLLTLVKKANAQELIYQYTDPQKSKAEVSPEDMTSEIESLKQAVEEVNRGPDRFDRGQSAERDHSLFDRIKKLLGM